jgi:hypothetical protein
LLLSLMGWFLPPGPRGRETNDIFTSRE